MHFKCQWRGEILARSAPLFLTASKTQSSKPAVDSFKQPGKEVPDECNAARKDDEWKAVEELDVLVVGAGFAGIYQLERSAS